MTRLITMNRWNAFGIYIIVDVFAVGVGMGVPLLAILLGFPVGWVLAARVGTASMRESLRAVMRGALITSGFTMLQMLAIWGPFSLKALDPATDFCETGVPMLLFEPFPSFIAWNVLMIVIAPFLQVLMTVLGAHVRLMRRESS